MNLRARRNASSRSGAARTLAGLSALAAAVTLSGCGGTASGGSSGSAGSAGFKPPDVPMASSLGKGEGAVSILAWPGYAEDGSTDKSVDWVKPFEKQTGCTATVKYFNTSDEAVNLMKGGQYDVVSASGDATLRLIAAGDVAPVNTDLVKNYADVAPFLKDQKFNSVDGQMYGIPHGWGTNLLMYSKKSVTTKPTSWGAVFEGASDYPGKVTAYDSPIYIADAALYLMKHQPDLGIKDPYALDEKQLDAAMDLLQKQKPDVGEYWSDYTKEVSAFKSGSSVIGTTWQVIANLTDEETPVGTVLPEEGSTAWSDTWMVAAKSKHPNCAYQWMDYVISPKVNAEVANYFGEAPANLKACDVDAALCKTFHADDEAYAAKLHYWTTPIKQCLDGRKTTCTDYAEWTKRWLELKG